MALSDFTKNRRTTDGSRATEGLFNRPLSDLSVNLDQLNSDVSTELDKKADSGDVAASDHTHAAGDVDVGSFADARISEGNVTQHEGAIDHDALTNFVSAEHIDWTTDSGSTIDAGNLDPDFARYDDSSASFEGQVGSKRTDVGTGGSHHTFDLDEGNAQKVQLTSDTTLHFANADPGHAYVLEIQQAGGSSHSVFWDPGVVPSTKTLPQMPSANSESLVASVYANSTSTFIAGEFGTGALEGW